MKKQSKLKVNKKFIEMIILVMEIMILFFVLIIASNHYGFKFGYWIVAFPVLSIILWRLNHYGNNR